MASSVSEAEDHLAKGQSLSKKKLFKKPAWREAGDEYEKAGIVFKAHKLPERSAEAFAECARCYAECGLVQPAAEKLTWAANLLAPKGLRPLNAGRAYGMLLRAHEYLRQCGKHKQAADLMFRAAEVAQKEQPIKALEALDMAIDIYKNEERVCYSIDSYELKLKIQLETPLSAAPSGDTTTLGNKAAIQTLEEMKDAYSQLKQPHNIKRASLAEIMLHLVGNNPDAADDEFMSMPDIRCAEGEAASELIDAFRERDPLKWRQATRNTGVMAIWPFVYKLLSTVYFDQLDEADSEKQKGDHRSAGRTPARSEKPETHEDSGYSDSEYSL